MTPEQMNELKRALETARAVCDEAAAMISDYERCESETSKKYLAAAIRKHASAVTAGMPAWLAG